MSIQITLKFSITLKNALVLNYGECPSTSFIANNFNLRAIDSQTITRETARKWLIGKSFPEASKLNVLVEWLGINPQDFLGSNDSKITSNIINKSPVIERRGYFPQQILDALSSQIAVVDFNGQILQVNKSWQRFALGKNEPTNEEFFRKYNYLDVCEKAKGQGSDQALQMSKGIRSVLSKNQSEFVLKYTCHAPHKKRWFVARVTPLVINGQAHAVIAHEAVSEENYLKLSFK